MKHELEHYAGLRHEILSREQERALLDELAATRTEAATGKRGAGLRLKRLRDRLVACNLRLIVRIAKGFRGLPLEDRLGEGVIGLLRALDDFDISRGFALSTYAAWWIRQTIRRACQDKARTVRVSVHVLQARGSVLRARDRFAAAAGRDPTLEELAEMTRTSPSLCKAVIGITSPISLDAPAFDATEPGTLHDVLSNVDAPTPLDAALAKERATEARKAAAILSGKERAVIEGRFGFDGGKRRTLDEVAASALGGRSRERARQVEQGALRRMRRTVADVRLA